MGFLHKAPEASFVGGGEGEGRGWGKKVCATRARFMIPSVAQAQIRPQGPSSKREEDERAWERTCTNILQFYIYYNHYIILLW